MLRSILSHVAPLAIIERLVLAWKLNQACGLVLLDDRGVRRDVLIATVVIEPLPTGIELLNVEAFSVNYDS